MARCPRAGARRAAAAARLPRERVAPAAFPARSRPAEAPVTAPATAPPAIQTMRRQPPPLRTGARISYFGPAADEVVIDTRKLDQFGVVSPHPLHESLNCCVQIEDQAARLPVTDHALQPEERSNPRTPRHLRDGVQAGSRIEHEVPGRHLAAGGAVIVFDDQFAAVVFLRLG